MKSTLVESHAYKEEEGGGVRGIDKANNNNSNLELRLGISCTTTNNNNNNKELITTTTTTTTSTSCEPRAASGPSPNNSRFMTSLLNGLGLMSPILGTDERMSWVTEPAGCSAGFIHPWSLAARQQKAVYEQAHQRSYSSTTPAVPRFTPPALPPIVGWPPVRSSRRNLTCSGPIKREMERDNEKEAKKAKLTDDNNGEKKSLDVGEATRPATSTMFVKVNMEGFAVGRKINLKAHDSYESLSRALQKMFTNFLSTNYSNNPAQEEQDVDHNSNHILLYEDHEGDRMLVGDVPWELFINSVKRLYIAHGPKAPISDDEKVKDEKVKGEQR